MVKANLKMVSSMMLSPNLPHYTSPRPEFKLKIPICPKKIPVSPPSPLFWNKSPGFLIYLYHLYNLLKRQIYQLEFIEA